ncbi:hypothetical protein AB0F68_16170 [Micromonospora sp. NPDC023966]
MSPRVAFAGRGGHGTATPAGAAVSRRALPRWFTLSEFAAVPRPAARA